MTQQTQHVCCNSRAFIQVMYLCALCAHIVYDATQLDPVHRIACPGRTKVHPQSIAVRLAYLFHDIESEVLGHEHLTGTVATVDAHKLVSSSCCRVSVGVQSTPIPLRALPELLLLFPSHHHLIGNGGHYVRENASTGRRVPCAQLLGPRACRAPGALGGGAFTIL